MNDIYQGLLTKLPSDTDEIRVSFNSPLLFLDFILTITLNATTLIILKLASTIVIK